VRVYICGPLRVESETATVTEEAFPGRLGRRLWAYLVLNRRRLVSRSELADALWADEWPEAGDASLNALVSRVRALLHRVGTEPAELRGSTGAYALVLPGSAFVDRERAWTAINHVRASREHGDIRAAWAEAVIANEIAARGLLPGEDGVWIEAERRTLRDIELRALEAIGQAEIDRHRADEAERVGRRLIAADPLRESGYRLLMLALAAGGNPAQAAGVINECRATLAAAGASPSAETERVYREVIGHPRRRTTSAG
jgi:DNA-binding SARP family transcriptional activator